MNTIEEIAKCLGITVHKRGEKTFLVQVTDVDAILGFCRREKLTVLGIETFREIGSGLTPDMEFIADFSNLKGLPSAERWRRSVDEAENFVRRAQIPADRLLDFEIESSGSDSSDTKRAVE